MRWEGRRESGNVLDQRKFGAGSLGIGGLVLGAIVYAFFGGNPIDYVAQNADQVGGTSSTMTQSASREQEAQKRFVSVVLADTEDIWGEQFNQQGASYQAPQLVLFRERVRSGCGSASAATGPFYCPADKRVYLDLSFFDELSSRLGARGDFAAGYVIAHEVGHHVQNLLGFTEKTERAYGGRSNRSSVAIELQADCLAGVWAGQLEKRGSILEAGDIDEALGAATAVGDDRLQSMGGGEVVPDSFTHGSSSQRVAAFRQGYNGRTLESCAR
jgi:predicted metalloprotease